MVILGAGASQDFVGPEVQTDWRPPLTDQLVEDNERTRSLLNTVPDLAASQTAAKLRIRLQRDPEESLEAVLRDLFGERPRNIRAVVAFRLYLQAYFQMVSGRVRAVGGVTNHALLVNEIERWRDRQKNERIVWVTFNYDTILDHALAGEYGWNVRNYPGADLPGYHLHRNFALFKLHGSYNWMRPTTARSEQAVMATSVASARWELLDAAANFLDVARHGEWRVTSDDLSLVDDWVQEVDTDADSPSRYLMMPSLSIPTDKKSEFACPNSHVTELDALMHRVDKIVSIGWKGAELTFLERLARATDGRAPRLLAVNRRAASRDQLVGQMEQAGITVDRALQFERDHEAAFTDFAASGRVLDYLG